jgi:hypothetical protein
MKHSKKAGSASAVAGLALLLAACATTPSAPPAPPTAAQTAAMALAAQSGRPEFPGFVLTIRKGEELYCQKRNPTGSRARVVEACYTRDQMLKMAANADDFFKQAGANGSHDSLRTDSPR